jgi:NAD(P)-dependent dehydrogenase (short-subunit alcohol dehydrogenase family)
MSPESMPLASAPVTVVTGANSGIGRAVAIHLAGQGHSVYGTVRSFDKAAKLNAMAADAHVEVKLVELDVADDDSVAAGFARVFDQAGRVDVLVNNAGVGGNGTVEETTIDTYAEVMNVDLYGQLRCLKAVLPSMRQRRSGTVVNITSVVGRVAALAQAPYVASKWALEGVSEQLAQEVARFGIRVAIIEPGLTKSAILAKNTEATEAGSDYEPHLRRMFQFYAAGYPHATDPFEVAKVVHHAITTDTPTLRYAVSWGGPELITGRSEITDEQWVALGAIEDDDDYYRAYSDTFGIDITGKQG